MCIVLFKLLSHLRFKDKKQNEMHILKIAPQSFSWRKAFFFTPRYSSHGQRHPYRQKSAAVNVTTTVREKKRKNLMYYFNPDQMKQGLNSIPPTAGPDKTICLICVCCIMLDLAFGTSALSCFCVSVDGSLATLLRWDDEVRSTDQLQTSKQILSIRIALQHHALDSFHILKFQKLFKNTKLDMENNVSISHAENMALAMLFVRYKVSDTV